MKLIFAGTPEFAAVSLKALQDSEHQVVAVYTQPDRPAGRGRKLRPGPVKRLALEQGLAIRQPRQLAAARELQELADLGAEAMVVAAYGLLLPQSVLDIPVHGCINVHASLLPRWRGAAPVQYALLAGDTETGISIMQMDAGLDTGPILRQCPLAIRADDTGASLHDRLAPLGAECLLRCLDDIERGHCRPQPQEASRACYAPRLDKARARIDWRLQAREIECMVRAFNPWPVAHALLPAAAGPPGQGPRPATGLRIHAATTVSTTGAAAPGEILQADREALVVACGSGALKLLEVQLSGRRRLPAADFLNAWPLAPGSLMQ